VIAQTLDVAIGSSGQLAPLVLPDDLGVLAPPGHAVLAPRAAPGTLPAFGYLRVSDPRQAGEHKVSLATQLEHILDHCRRKGYTLLEIFVDTQSGRRTDRVQYLDMVRRLLDGAALVVLIQYLDRFGRNDEECLPRVWQLRASEVKVEATDEDISNRWMLNIKATYAAERSDDIRAKVRATMLTHARDGMHAGRAPYGYRRVPGGGRAEFEQHAEEAGAVREMWRLAVEEGLGYKSIADRLAAGGHPARAGTWSGDSVAHIMNSESLVGTEVFGKKPRKHNRATAAEPIRHADYYPAILSADEWATLRVRLLLRAGKRGRPASPDYLLSGIARCGYCGGPMVGKMSYARRDRNDTYRQYRNYSCSNAQRGRDKCTYYNGHSVPRLERAILEHLGQYDDPDRVRELLAKLPARGVSDATDELRRIERRLAELDRDFQQNLDLLKRGVLDEGDFQRANAGRKDERAGLETRRDTIASQVKDAQERAAMVAAVPRRVRGFLEDVEHLEPRKAKALLQGILSAAHVYRDGRIELEFRTT
jgi:site-specific DNA recombinase